MRTTIPLQWLKLAAFALAACTLALQAHAQTRTWVSGVGDDVNPCSRTAPCKTFAGAISKTAAGGEINILDSGGFGAVTITKSITINGDGALASIVSSLTTGIFVNAGANDVVTLRGLEINGTGNGINGINFLAGGALVLERVQVYGASQNGLLFAPAGNARLVVTDSIFRNNGGSGIHIAPAPTGTATATLSHVTLASNARGIRVEDGTRAFVTGSVSEGNTGNGYIANGASRPAEITIEASSAFANGAAGVFSGALSTVRISRMNVSGNGTGLALGGGQIVSAGNNSVSGNTANGAPSSAAPEI